MGSFWCVQRRMTVTKQRLQAEVELKKLRSRKSIWNGNLAGFPECRAERHAKRVRVYLDRSCPQQTANPLERHLRGKREP